MAQILSKDEKAPGKVRPSTQGRPARAAKRPSESRDETTRRALDALAVRAEAMPNRESMELFLRALNAAADAVANLQPVSGPMPAAEQAIWESAGANFNAKTARRFEAENAGRVAAMFEELRSRCVVGDKAMAEALQVDRSRISQRLADGSLYAFTAGPNEERHYPRWQLDGHRTLRGLKAVLAKLPAMHPFNVDHWFHTPNEELLTGDEEKTSPLDWLLSGGSIDDAVQAAELDGRGP